MFVSIAINDLFTGLSSLPSVVATAIAGSGSVHNEWTGWPHHEDNGDSCTGRLMFVNAKHIASTTEHCHGIRA